VRTTSRPHLRFRPKSRLTSSPRGPGALPDPDDAASPLAEILAVTASSTADDERTVDESVADEQVDAVRLSGVTKTFGATVAVDAIDLRSPPAPSMGSWGPTGRARRRRCR
jgi:ABC-2 type transport system ATP-binding protein